MIIKVSLEFETDDRGHMNELEQELREREDKEYRGLKLLDWSLRDMHSNNCPGGMPADCTCEYF